MKKSKVLADRFNTFLKHTKGKCPIIAQAPPFVSVLKCMLENRLASGIFICGKFENREMGSFFWQDGRGRNFNKTGPGGVKYRGWPDWDELKPPGRPIPLSAPKKYVWKLTDEAADIMRDSGLFVYSLIYYDPEGRSVEWARDFGERFIPGIVNEADNIMVAQLRKRHQEKPFKDRDEAYAAARQYMRKRIEQNPYGLAGSNVHWYQAASITRQKRWDHEIANGNFQIQQSFLRGVSQQRDIPFITYVAPMITSEDGLWGTKVDPETPFGKIFNVPYSASGKPDDLLEREWYVAWFAGAAAVVIEASEFYLFNKGPDEDTMVPGSMGPAMKKLNELAWESDFERGKPCRPACILMDERHGWTFTNAPDAHNYETPDIVRRKIWGVFDYQHQDIMVDNFFGAVYPGYETGSQWGGRGGDLVQTPFGDSFDVLMSNAPGKALGKYPVVFPLGQPKLTAAFKKRLEDYVRSGGTLVLNISQVDYEWQQFLGVKFTPKYNRWYVGLGTLRASDRSEWLEPERVWEENRYHYSRVQAKKAEVLARTEQGDPLVVCNKVGKGRVYMVTAHHLQEISGLHRPNGLLEVSKFLIGHVLEPHQKVKVRGEPIHTMVNETGGGLSVMVLNNGKKRWQGWIAVPGMAKAAVKEWYAGKRLHTHNAGKELSIRLDIPAYSLRVISIEK